AVPVKPSIPVGAVELATVTIPSTATATNSSGVVITQTAQFTAAAGAAVPFRSKADLDMWTTPAAEATAVVLADGKWYRRSSGAWVDSDQKPGGSIKRTGTSGAFGGGAWTVLRTASLWAIDQPVFGVTYADGTFTIITPGWYEVEGGMMLDAAVQANLILKKNNLASDAFGIMAGNAGSGSSGFTTVNVKKRIRLAAGDTVCMAILPSASAQWSNDKLDPSFFGIRYLEPLR